VGGRYSKGGVEQCAAARDRLVRPRGHLHTFLDGNGHWQHAIDRMLSEQEGWEELAPKVARLLALARRRAAREQAERRIARCNSYWHWVDDQLRGWGRGAAQVRPARGRGTASSGQG